MLLSKKPHGLNAKFSLTQHKTKCTLKPIFHLKTGLRWVPNTNEIDTNNMKRHAQRQGTQCNLYSTCSRRGFALGVMQILAFALGVTQIVAVLDTTSEFGT